MIISESGNKINLKAVINMLENIKKDIQNLRGATVTVFGQSTVLRETEEYDDLVVDILDVIAELEGNEITDFHGFLNELIDNDDRHESERIKIPTVDSVDEVIDFLVDIGVVDNIPTTSDNSYNWNSPITNDFNFNIYYTDFGSVLVEFKVHRFGDIRGNYTETALLLFDSHDDFLYTMLENSSAYTSVDIDGKTFDLSVDIFSEGIEVYQDELDFSMTSYEYDMDDIIHDIKKTLNEE